MEEREFSQDLRPLEEQQLSQVLHAIAKQEIPNDMNKWPEIRAKLDTPQVRRPLRLSGYAAAALTLVALLTTSLVAYAVYQWGEGEPRHDPGIDGVRKAGLVEELDVPPITIDGVTITLTEGYADANRVAFWYTIDKPADMPEKFSFPTWTLTTPDGGFINHDMSPAPVDETENVPNKYGVILGLIEPLQGDEVELKLIASIGGMPIIMIPDDVTPTPGPIPEEYIVDAPLLGPFEFYVTLQVQQALELQPNVTVESNGIGMTIENVRVAPSQTTIHICFDLPTGRDWQPHFVSVDIDGHTGFLNGGYGSKFMSPEDTNRCADYDFAIPAIDEYETLNIVIDRLQTSISEGMEEVDFELAAERLAAQGVIVEFSGTGREFRYAIIEKPADMEEGEAGMAIWESLAQWYEGEWLFEIDLTTE